MKRYFWIVHTYFALCTPFFYAQPPHLQEDFFNDFALPTTTQDTIKKNFSVKEHPTIGEKFLVVVVPSYNNAAWYQKNLSSIFMQDYTNYHVIYIDDCSQDNTYALVKAYIQEYGQAYRVTLIRNKNRKGHLYNHLLALSLIPAHAIVVNIDGDDWLRLDEPRTDIFKMINTIYDNDQVWLTYGSYYRYPFGDIGTCKAFPDDVLRNGTYRSFAWVSSHLRTYYAWLFKHVHYADLLYCGDKPELHNTLWPAAADLSFMFPMLEMANGRIYYVPDIIYAYNRANPLNLCEGERLTIQNHCAALIRAKKPYAPLDDSVFWQYMREYRKEVTS